MDVANCPSSSAAKYADDMTSLLILQARPQGNCSTTLAPVNHHNDVRRRKRQTSEMTEEEAEALCDNTISSSSIVQAADGVLEVDSSSSIQNCVVDLMATGDESWVDVALDTVKSDVASQVELDTNTWEANPDEEDVEGANAGPLSVIEDELCPAACSGHGICQAGTCRCSTGWLGATCSINGTLPPEIDTDIPPEGCYGDTCSHVTISGTFADGIDIICKLLEMPIINLELHPDTTHITTTAKVMTLNKIYCPLNTPVSHNISLSYDGINFSDEVQFIQSGFCLTCDSTTCVTNNEGCFINSEKCYHPGERNPSNNQEICAPVFSNSKWTNAQVLSQVPTKLVIVQQPRVTAEQAPFGIQPTLRLLDQHGKFMSYVGSLTAPWKSEVALIIQRGGDASAALLGTTQVTFQNGMAHFSDLAINSTGKYKLLFSTLRPEPESNLMVTSSLIDIPHPVQMYVEVLSEPIVLRVDERFTVVVQLLDRRTKQPLEDLAWEGHSWTCEAVLYPYSKYDGSLHGTLQQDVNLNSSGIMTFNDLHFDTSSTIYVAFWFLSSPGKYFITGLTGPIRIDQDLYQMPTDAVKKQVVIKFIGDFGLMVVGKEEYFAATLSAELHQMHRKVAFMDFVISRGSIQAEFTVVGTDPDVTYVLNDLWQKVKDNMKVTFEEHVLMTQPNMWVDGEEFGGLESKSGGLHPGIIALIVIIAVGLIIAIAVVLIILCCKSKKNKNMSGEGQGISNPIMGKNIDENDSIDDLKSSSLFCANLKADHSKSNSKDGGSKSNGKNALPCESSSSPQAGRFQEDDSQERHISGLHKILLPPIDRVSSNERPPSSQSVRSAWSEENTVDGPRVRSKMEESASQNDRDKEESSQDHVAKKMRRKEKNKEKGHKHEETFDEERGIQRPKTAATNAQQQQGGDTDDQEVSCGPSIAHNAWCEETITFESKQLITMEAEGPTTVAEKESPTIAMEKTKKKKVPTATLR